MHNSYPPGHPCWGTAPAHAHDQSGEPALRTAAQASGTDSGAGADARRVSASAVWGAGMMGATDSATLTGRIDAAARYLRRYTQDGAGRA